MTLIALPISAEDRGLGLVAHYRRDDAPPEKPVRRCAVCGTRLDQDQRGRHCTAHQYHASGDGYQVTMARIKPW